MLAPWKKGYEKPRQHIKRQRPSLCQQRPIQSKVMVFPVVLYGCESWIIDKAECPRINAFGYGAGEDSWESLKSKKIKPFNSKGNEP